MAPETLGVDLVSLSRYGNDMLSAATDIPVAPAPFTAGGAGTASGVVDGVASAVALNPVSGSFVSVFFADVTGAFGKTTAGASLTAAGAGVVDSAGTSIVIAGAAGAAAGNTGGRSREEFSSRAAAARVRVKPAA